MAVRFSAPGATVEHVRDRVTLQLSVDDPDCDRVALSVDGVHLVDLLPPFQYDWDTSAHDEGAREIRASAFTGSRLLGQASRTFVVDRTPPSIASTEPAAAAAVDLASGIQLYFSERVTLSTPGAQLTVTVGDKTLDAALVLHEDGMSAQITLRGAVPTLPSSLTLNLGDGLLDLAGFPLSRGTWSFDVPYAITVRGPAAADGLDALAAGGERLCLAGATYAAGEEESSRAYVYTYDEGGFREQLIAESTRSIRTSVAASRDGARLVFKVDESCLLGACPTQSTLYLQDDDGTWTPLPPPSETSTVVREMRIDETGTIDARMADGVFRQYRDGAWSPAGPSWVDHTIYDFVRRGDDLFTAYRMSDSPSCMLVSTVDGMSYPPVTVALSGCDRVALAPLDDGGVVVATFARPDDDDVWRHGGSTGLMRWPGAYTSNLVLPRDLPGVTSDGRRYFVWAASGIHDQEGTLIAGQTFYGSTAFWKGRPVVLAGDRVLVLNIASE